MPTSDAKNILMQQRKAAIEAAVRSGKSGTRMLDDSDNNIGNSVVLQPQFLLAGILYTSIPQPPANNSRLLSLTSESCSGQSLTVTMTAARVNEPDGFVGPITGIIEFGNGSQFTRIEFDIPTGPYIGSIGSVASATEPQDGGTTIQVPTSVLRAYARYDNAFITPDITGHAFGSLGSVVPIIGPGFPRALNTTTPTPSRIKAFANYFGRIHTKLYKTQYIYIGDVLNPVNFYASILGVSDIPILYAVPPFAKSVRLVRSPQTTAMHLFPADQSGIFGEDILIPSGPCPTITIDGNTTLMAVSSAHGTTVSSVKLIYEIGF